MTKGNAFGLADVREFWDFDEETTTYHANVQAMISDTYGKMREVEEQVRLHAVVSYLREIGYKIQEPTAS